MSANNYSLIQKVGDKYYYWNNLNAEEAIVNDVLKLEEAKSFDTLATAVEYAIAHDDTEYGVSVNRPYKPKDGYPEKIEGHFNGH